jgi:hypothetical protein
MAKYAQKILFFFCRPGGDYHEKTHPHYRFHETQGEAPETQNRTTMLEAAARLGYEEAARRRAQGRVASRLSCEPRMPPHETNYRREVGFLAKMSGPCEST